MEAWFQLLFGFGCFSLLPMVLAVVAIIDVVRVGAGWYWVLIILFFPVVGAVVYFVIVRSGSFARLSPAAARRHQAKHRLRVLEVQLAHWRGPVPLAEAGEELLVLGKSAQAAEYLREAYDAEGPVEEVNYRYGLALAMLGRWKEAVPVMEELYDEDPGAKLGEARLHYGRCLDEAGEKEEAEGILREVLKHRKPFEARVRLARILLGKGQEEEARSLLAEVRRETTILPRYLKRDQAPWIRAARRLSSAGQKLPRPRVPGAFRRRPWSVVVTVAIAAAVVLLVLFFWFVSWFGGLSEGYDRGYDDSGYYDRGYDDRGYHDSGYEEETFPEEADEPPAIERGAEADPGETSEPSAPEAGPE